MAGLNDIVDTYGCEFKTRIVINDSGKIESKYIDLVHRLGVDTGLRFTYDINLNSIEKTTSDDSHFNVLYGRGSSLETEDGGYSRKINFGDVVWNTPGNPINKPSGQKFIEDSESIARYGRLEGIYENDNIDDPEVLLEKTYEKLQKVKELNHSYIVDAEDLKNFEGFEHYKYTLGDSIIVLDEDENITVEARILEINKEINLIENTEETKITLGNFRNGLIENEDDIKDVIDSIKGQIGNITDSEIDDSEFPDKLPDAPILTGKGLFATIMLEWTYENKMYYTYELFASKIKDFAPGPTNRIFEGKASAFLHEVNPEETWYYRARAKNTHDHYTDYSTQLTVSTYKISDSENYFEEAAIKDATIGELKLDRGWVGKLVGTYIDAKNLSVTDGNGKQTLLVDSFGRVYLDVTSLKIESTDLDNFVGNKAQTIATQTMEGFKTEASEIYLNKSTADTTYASKSEVVQTANQIKQEVADVYITNESAANSFTELDKNLQNNYTSKSEFNQTATSIESKITAKVGKDEIISSINQTAEAIKIKANKIDLDGYVWVSTQLTAPHITGKVQMYMETGSIFSSDGEMNVKRFYGMPNGTFNVESTATFTNQIYGKATGVFDGNLTCKSKLISNTGSITRDFSVGALLTAQNFTLANNASIGGTCYCNSQETTYDSNVGRNLVVSNNTRTKTLSVTGDSTLNALSTATITNTGNATIKGTLTAQNQTVNNNLTVSRNMYAYAGEVTTSLTIGGTVYANGNVNIQRHLWANSLAISGTKNCVQDTENFGKRLINAYETADYLFGDVGESIIENGECIVYLDDIFKEVISTDVNYQVFLTKYGKGDIWVSERHSDYFVVQAENDIRFAWEIKAKRKGYENYRLEEYVEENEYAQENNTI